MFWCRKYTKCVSLRLLCLRLRRVNLAPSLKWVAGLGSTFGSLPFDLRSDLDGAAYVQPSNEQFANNLALEWLRLDPARWVYVEDEGIHIGQTSVPTSFFHSTLRRCDVVVRWRRAAPFSGRACAR